jgi:proline utilization trans-activator
MLPQQYQHRLKLWWTVYILERRLSSLMGTPPLLDDEEDISVPLPDSIGTSGHASASKILTLHVTLSQVLGKAVRSLSCT